MLMSPRARKLVITAASLGLTAGLVPHAMAFPLLGDILSNNQTDCSAAGNNGNIDSHDLAIINAGNGTSNNNCQVLSGNSLLANGLLGAPLLGSILSGNDCGAAGNTGQTDPSGFDGSLNGLEIINAGNGATNNNCSVLSGDSILSGNSLFTNGLFGGPLLGDINVLSGGNASEGGSAGNGGGNILVAPLTGIGINQCTTVSVLLGLGSNGGCANGLGIINLFNGFGGF
jgi:hypothetical protein